MTPTRRLRPLLAAAAFLAASAPAPPAAAAERGATGELAHRGVLRICNSPKNLPYSDESGAGFEDKIAALLAKAMGVKVRSAWYPRATGYIRNTLRANRCDLVVGITGVHELVQNSNPYYRTMWTMVLRADDPRAPADLDSPALREMKLGVMESSPPVTALAKRGLLKNSVSYRLRTDSRVEQPAVDMLRDLAAGKLDAAFSYGPIAGYWAEKMPVPLRVVPLDSEKSGTRMDFLITMGVRHNEPLWKLRVNRFLRRNREKISEILREHRVPTLPIQRGEKRRTSKKLEGSEKLELEKSEGVRAGRIDAGRGFQPRPESSAPVRESARGNKNTVIAEFRVSEMSATSAERRLAGPRSREVADIFSPRLASRQKNSAMTTEELALAQEPGGGGSFRAGIQSPTGAVVPTGQGTPKPEKQTGGDVLESDS